MHALLPPHPSVPYKHAAMQCPTNRLHCIFANIGYSVFQSGTAVTAEVVVMSGHVWQFSSHFCNCNNLFQRVSLITGVVGLNIVSPKILELTHCMNNNACLYLYWKHTYCYITLVGIDFSPFIIVDQIKHVQTSHLHVLAKGLPGVTLLQIYITIFR